VTGTLVNHSVVAVPLSRETPSSQQMALNPFGRTDTNKNASGWARAVLEPKP
jgi:hypothetical protein